MQLVTRGKPPFTSSSCFRVYGKLRTGDMLEVLTAVHQVASKGALSGVLYWLAKLCGLPPLLYQNAMKWYLKNDENVAILTSKY